MQSSAETPAIASSSAGDPRPLVARAVTNRGPLLFAGILAASAIGLFVTLETRREALTSPAVIAPAGIQDGRIAPPPELVIPGDFADPLPPRSYAPFPQRTFASVPMRSATMAAPDVRLPRMVPRSAYNGAPTGPNVVAPPAPAYVYQIPVARPSPAVNEDEKAGARVSATRLTNPVTTVPQGAIIQAVLETALDSTRPGFVRAVVSRDVLSFDGSRVLIQRGSKLFGEYKADLASGQNRALIQWHRLTRPDGVIIDIDSPSADPLGRAGVKGKVNSHFFARFGSAILQSFLDVGVQLAARKATGDTIIVGLPGSAPQVTVTKQEDVRPTLAVKEGTSVSVFVGRDLDFTDVEQ